jgi:ankyrin repeat protein
MFKGWTPAHLASFLGNFDALNLLIEYGANLHIKHNHGMTCLDEIVRNDNRDLFECVFEHTKEIKRNLKEVSKYSVI